jgi:hypothetical protein
LGGEDEPTRGPAGGFDAEDGGARARIRVAETAPTDDDERFAPPQLVLAPADEHDADRELAPLDGRTWRGRSSRCCSHAAVGCM